MAKKSEKGPYEGRNKYTILAIGALILLTLVPYANAPLCGFVYDDRTLIADNPFIKDISHVGSSFLNGYWWGTEWGTSDLYRPITIISYILNYYFSGNSPFSFHLVNVILHLIAVMAVFYCVTLLFPGTHIPLMTAALFAVHPIHTEAVTGVVGRAEILSALFFVIALSLYIRSCEDWKSGSISFPLYLFSLLSYLLALLAKENAIVFAAMIPIIAAFLDSRKKASPRLSFASSALNSKRMLILSGYLAVTAAYLVLRWKVLGSNIIGMTVSQIDNPMAQANIYQRIVTSAFLFLKYMILMIFPMNLSVDYSAWQIPLSTFPPSPAYLIGVISALLFLLLLIITYRRYKELFFPLSLFAITFIIPSNLFIAIGTIFAERLMYLPSLALCLLAGIALHLLLAKLRTTRLRQANERFLYGVIVIVIILMGLRTFARNGDWQNSLTLFAAAVKSSPMSARAHANLGKALADGGRYNEALKEYDEALSIYPAFARVHVKIGNIYADRGKSEEALAEFAKAIEINPRDARARYNLAVVYESLGKTAEAEKEYGNAIDLFPLYAEAMNNLGALYLKEKRFGDALRLFQQAFEEDPEKTLALRNQGEAYLRLARYQEGVDALKRYLKTADKDPKGYYLLAYACIGQEKFLDAINAFKKSIELGADFPEMHFMLSDLYKKVGMEKESLEEKGYAREMKKSSASRDDKNEGR